MILSTCHKNMAFLSFFKENNCKIIASLDFQLTMVTTIFICDHNINQTSGIFVLLQHIFQHMVSFQHISGELCKAEISDHIFFQSPDAFNTHKTSASLIYTWQVKTTHKKLPFPNLPCLWPSKIIEPIPTLPR